MKQDALKAREVLDNLIKIISDTATALADPGYNTFGRLKLFDALGEYVIGNRDAIIDAITIRRYVLLDQFDLPVQTGLNGEIAWCRTEGEADAAVSYYREIEETQDYKLVDGLTYEPVKVYTYAAYVDRLEADHQEE